MAASLSAFICIDLASDLKRTLDRATKQAARSPWSAAAGPIRWVAPDQMHITLCFLGEVDWNQTPRICKIAQEILATEPPFSFSCEGWGGFPSLVSPRVLWAGVRELEDKAKSTIDFDAGISGNSAGNTDQRAACPRMTRLSERLVQAFLDNRFFPDTKPAQPHVTLARLSRSTETNQPRSQSRARDPEQTASQISDSERKEFSWDSEADREFGVQIVRELKLMSSERTAYGPIYRPIATLPLAKKSKR